MEQTRWPAQLSIAICLAVGLPQTPLVLAQSASDRAPKFLAGVHVHDGAPLSGGAGGELLIPVAPWRCEDGLCGAGGLEIQSSIGLGGWRVAGGPVLVGLPLWVDLLATVARTSDTPRRASARSTYVGAAWGFAFPLAPIGSGFLDVRPELGVAHRIKGPAGSRATTFTWQIGLHAVWPKF